MEFSLVELIFTYIALCAVGAVLFIIMASNGEPIDEYYVTETHKWTMKRKTLHYLPMVLGSFLLIPIFAVAGKIIPLLGCRKL